jgi:hypothetical protein
MTTNFHDATCESPKETFNQITRRNAAISYQKRARAGRPMLTSDRPIGNKIVIPFPGWKARLSEVSGGLAPSGLRVQDAFAELCQLRIRLFLFGKGSFEQCDRVLKAQNPSERR